MEDAVKVYNLGARIIKYKSGKDGMILPKKVATVPAETAKKLFKMYPKELVEWGKDLPAEKKPSKLTLAEARKIVAEAEAAEAAAAEETGGPTAPAPAVQEEPAAETEVKPEENKDQLEEKPKKKGRK